MRILSVRPTLGSLCLVVALGVGSESAAAQLVPEPLPGLRADVAALIMQGVPGGSLPVALAVVRGTDPGSPLRLVGEVAGSLLLPDSNSAGIAAKPALEFYAYVFSADGAVIAHAARRIPLNFEHWGERLVTGGIRIAEDFAVSEPSVTVRALVYAPWSQRFGVQIVDWQDNPQEASWLQPRVDQDCSEWLTASSIGDELTSARPVLRIGEEVSVAVGLPAGNRDGTLARATPSRAVLSREGREDESVEVAADSGVGAVDSAARFVVPEVPEGVYFLRLASEAPEAARSLPLEVWVVEHDKAGTGGCGWPSVMASARASLARAGQAGLNASSVEALPEPSDASDSRRSVRRARSRSYLTLVGRYGTGQDFDAAVEALVDFELQELDGRPQTVGELGAAQFEVIRALAQRDRECLLPLFLLHQAAYRSHFVKRNFALAGHSRQMAVAIAELWIDGAAESALKEGISTVDASLAADALVALAETADRHRMFAASQGILERAIEIHPKSRAARVVLSMLYEKLGEYDAAATHLEALLDAHPADAEGRLRLATLTHRLGRLEASERAARWVIRQRPQKWILSLAYQTLSQVLFKQERFAEALGELTEAELVLPEDPSLRLAAAYALDRLGRGAEAARVIEEIPVGLDQAAPRFRYTDSGSLAARAAVRRLRRGAGVRRPRLQLAAAAALEESG